MDEVDTITHIWTDKIKEKLNEATWQENMSEI